MRIAVIGLGLIGGSLAKAIKSKTPHTVIGCDLQPQVCEAALRCGAVDTVCTGVPQAELYVLALAPAAVLAYLQSNASAMQANAIVTDVCGVKAVLVAACETCCAENSLRFVGGHPMAGREVSGFENSVAGLFDNRNYILTATCQTDTAAVETLRGLVLQLGVNHVTVTTPENHDRMIAFTSQLPHILAGAYIISPTSREHYGYSAGSYHDVSRVSTVDEQLWSELFLDNRDNLTKELERLLEHLNAYRQALNAGDRAALAALIREGRLCKESDLRSNGSEQPHKFG